MMAKSSFYSVLILSFLLVAVIIFTGCANKEPQKTATTIAQTPQQETGKSQLNLNKCGNSICGDLDTDENKCTCPTDCGQCSGDAGTCLEFACSGIECAAQRIPKCCGNYVCEEPENFESCPSDCSPNSMIDKIKISENDLPLIVGNSPWSIDRDDSVGEYQVDSSIRGLGLIAGRNIGFTSDKASVNQQILIFPMENINKVLDATNKNEILRWGGSPEDMYELPSPNIGDKSRAFKLLLNKEPYMYYVAFTKKGYYELLEIRGRGEAPADYKSLEDIARKAADKIN